MDRSLLLHRPDINPGKGFRVLTIGEVILPTDECRQPIPHSKKWKWEPASAVLVGKAANYNMTAVRRKKC